MGMDLTFDWSAKSDSHHSWNVANDSFKGRPTNRAVSSLLAMLRQMLHGKSVRCYKQKRTSCIGRLSSLFRNLYWPLMTVWPTQTTSWLFYKHSITTSSRYWCQIHCTVIRYCFSYNRKMFATLLTAYSVRAVALFYFISVIHWMVLFRAFHSLIIKKYIVRLHCHPQKIFLVRQSIKGS